MSLMHDLLSTSKPEFQCIVIIEDGSGGDDDDRLFPLTENVPKCLLPICNRPILHYQLDQLVLSGAVEIFIIGLDVYKDSIDQCIKEYKLIDRDMVHIEVIILEEMNGSVDGLRAVKVKNLIRGDFVVISGDFITQFSLGELARLHRTNSSDITCLLSVMPLEEGDAKSSRGNTTAKKSLPIDKEDQEIIGYGSDGRLVVKSQLIERSESTFSLEKSLLHKCDSLRVRNDLIDTGIYFMSYWILEYIMKSKSITSIRLDLIPYLVNWQFQCDDDVLNHDQFGDAIKNRIRPLNVIEKVTPNSSLIDYFDDLIKSRPRVSEGVYLANVSIAKSTELTRQLSLSLLDRTQSAVPASTGISSDLIKCYTKIIDHQNSITLPSYASAATNSSNIIMQRVSNLKAYWNLTKDIMTYIQNNTTTPASWPSIIGYQRDKLSVVGTHCEIGDKVTIKQCCIGNNSKINSKSKINNCVIFGNVTIGENCTIQNSVICSNAIIENNCNINDCYIGANAKVVSGTKVKGETITPPRADEDFAFE